MLPCFNCIEDEKEREKTEFIGKLVETGWDGVKSSGVRECQRQGKRFGGRQRGGRKKESDTVKREET